MLTTMAAGSQTANDQEVPRGPDGLRELIAAYRSHTPPVTMARMFVTFRERHGLSQQALGRLIGTSPGSIHHYESLLTLPPRLIEALEAGALTFKEGRALADIRVNGRASAPDHARQIEVARPFIDKTLSSLFAEPLIALVQAHPDRSTNELINMAHARIKVAHPRVDIRPPRLHPAVPLPLELKTKMIELAALATAVSMRPYPEIEMLAIRNVTRILIDCFKAAGLYPLDEKALASPASVAGRQW